MATAFNGVTGAENVQVDLTTDTLSADMDAPDDGWNVKAVLWIHLYHDLLLVAADAPARPVILTSGDVVFTNYLEFVGLREVDEDKQRFLEKRKGLVSTKMTTILDVSYPRTTSRNAPVIDAFTITSPMLEQYQELRGDLDLGKELPLPPRDEDLWRFLQNGVLKEYPELSMTRQDDPVELPSDSNCASPPKTTSGLWQMPHTPELDTQLVEHDQEDVPTGLSPTKKKAPVPSAPAITNNIVKHSKRNRASTESAMPGDAEESSAKHQRAESPKQPKRKAKEPQNTLEPQIKKKHPWSAKEHDIIFTCLNDWCHKKGIHEFTKSKIKYPIVDALKEGTKSDLRNKNIVESKLKSIPAIKDLDKRAEELRKEIEKGKTHPRKYLHPKEMILQREALAKKNLKDASNHPMFVESGAEDEDIDGNDVEDEDPMDDDEMGVVEA